MSRDNQDLSERILGAPGQRFRMILVGLLGGLAGGTLVFLDTHDIITAVGYAVAIALFVIVGWNISRNARAPERHPSGSVPQQMHIRDAPAGTKVLAIVGLLLALPGFWLMRDDQSILGIPLLMVAFVPLLVVRHRLTGAPAMPAGPDLQK